MSIRTEEGSHEVETRWMGTTAAKRGAWSDLFWWVILHLWCMKDGFGNSPCTDSMFLKCQINTYTAVSSQQ